MHQTQFSEKIPYGGFSQLRSHMCKLALKDAYLSIPIHQSFRKSLKFTWHGRTYEYTALPFGLSAAPRVFTKLLKPILGSLRETGIHLIAYLDNFLLIGKTKNQAEEPFQKTKTLMDSLGFVINEDKSQSEANQKIEFLGSRIFDRFNGHDVQTDCYANKPDQGEVQTSLGEQSGDAQGISPHSRCVSGHTTSSSASSSALQIIASPKERRDPPPLENDSESSEPGRPLLVEDKFEHGQWQTDPSNTSRGSHRIGCFQHGMGSRLQECEDKRSVVHEESSLHINCKETLAAFLTLQSFVKNIQGVHVRLKVDNTMYYINHMGGTHSPQLMKMTTQMWTWCLDRKLFLSAEHLSGKLNQVADQESRMLGDSSEWKLNPVVFSLLMKQLGPCSVDLFASRLTAQLHQLEARSRSTGDRCPITAVDGHARICFPSVHTDRKMPDQGTSEGVTTGTDCTNMADAALVSCAAVDDTQRACENTANSRSVTESQRRDSPSNS